jgi:hypothetical protein
VEAAVFGLVFALTDVCFALGARHHESYAIYGYFRVY